MTETWCADSLDLFTEPAPAVLTTYRKNGSASSSPVWFRLHDGGLEVVIATDDVKLRHLEADPRCSLLVFETSPPFRGVRLEGVADLRPDSDGQARLEIANRYLGLARGRMFAEQRETPGFVLRIEPTSTSQWDLGAILPPD